MRLEFGFLALTWLASSAAMADNAIDVARAVFVERRTEGARTLEKATTLRSGDKVVLVVETQAPAPGRRFMLASAVPRTLAFQRAGSDSAQVSIDGGRSWGELGNLRVGDRLASAEDVTHIRQRIEGTTTGRMTFSAIVR